VRVCGVVRLNCHPRARVLFLQISGYTAESTQIGPSAFQARADVPQQLGRQSWRERDFASAPMRAKRHG